jgi:hypothetical protein
MRTAMEQLIVTARCRSLMQVEMENILTSFKTAKSLDLFSFGVDDWFPDAY